MANKVDYANTILSKVMVGAGIGATAGAIKGALDPDSSVLGSALTGAAIGGAGGYIVGAHGQQIKDGFMKGWNGTVNNTVKDEVKEKVQEEVKKDVKEEIKEEIKEQGAKHGAGTVVNEAVDVNVPSGNTEVVNGPQNIKTNPKGKRSSKRAANINNPNSYRPTNLQARILNVKPGPNLFPSVEGINTFKGKPSSYLDTGRGYLQWGNYRNVFSYTNPLPASDAKRAAGEEFLRDMAANGGILPNMPY